MGTNSNLNSNISPDILDKETIENLLFLGDDVFMEIIELYLQESPKKLAEMLACAQTENMEGLSSIAHSLKGASLNIGAHYLAEICLQIEHAGKGGNASGLQSMLSELQDRYRKTLNALKTYFPDRT